MNISIKKEDFQLSALDENGKFFEIEDSIGFSTANGKQGFNRADAGETDGAGGTYPEYVDGFGNPYPKINKTVLAMLPYLNQYHKDDIKVTSLLTPIERNLEVTLNDLGERITPDYSEIAYNHQVALEGNGWYTVYVFLVDLIDTAAGESLPIEGVYYDKASQRYYDSDGHTEIELADMLNRTDVKVIDLQYFPTPGLERKLHDLVGDMADLGIKEGNCAKNYLKAQRAVLFYEGQLSGAHVKFNDGYQHKAQQIIEDLENSNPYADC